MTEQLCDFAVCKLAKEKGFDEECMEHWEWYIFEGEDHGPNAFGRRPIDFRKWAVRLEETQAWPMLYNKTFWPQKNSELPPYHYARPSQSLLVRWLREKHGYSICVQAMHDGKWVYGIQLLKEESDNSLFKPGLYSRRNGEGEFNTYEIAESAALQYALTLIK